MQEPGGAGTSYWPKYVYVARDIAYRGRSFSSGNGIDLESRLR